MLIIRRSRLSAELESTKSLLDQLGPYTSGKLKEQQKRLESSVIKKITWYSPQSSIRATHMSCEKRILFQSQKEILLNADWLPPFRFKRIFVILIQEDVAKQGICTVAVLETL